MPHIGVNPVRDRQMLRRSRTGAWLGRLDRPGLARQVATRMNDSEDQIAAFVDYAALTYQEARNVRHLVRAGFIAAEDYQRLINLPRERKAAWREMQPARAEAKTKTTARAAEAVFRVRFGVGLKDLDTLYGDSHWRHSALGGNRWADITRAVLELRDAIDGSLQEAASALVRRIACLNHNTGSVAGKLRSLDACLDTPSSRGDASPFVGLGQ